MLTISDNKGVLLLVLVNDAACWSAKVQLEFGNPTLRLVILFVTSSSQQVVQAMPIMHPEAKVQLPVSKYLC
jgi:hypothetical protein